MRAGLNQGLGFSLEDRRENIRRTAEASVLMANAGFIVLCSLVSPCHKDRETARRIVLGKNLPFFEVFVSTPLEECERRDTKGLYRRCRAGEIKGSIQHSNYEFGIFSLNFTLSRIHGDRSNL